MSNEYLQIANLKIMLEDEENNSKHPLPLPGAILTPPVAWDRPYVTEETSDILIKSFFSHVDPFIRLIHAPKFFLDLNRFRRKVLANSEQFEVELYAIYGLAMLSLTVPEVEKLGFDKPVFSADCKRYIENGLTWLGVTTSHDVSILRILLHFIVSLTWLCLPRFSL